MVNTFNLTATIQVRTWEQSSFGVKMLPLLFDKLDNAVLRDIKDLYIFRLYTAPYVAEIVSELNSDDVKDWLTHAEFEWVDEIVEVGTYVAVMAKTSDMSTTFLVKIGNDRHNEVIQSIGTSNGLLSPMPSFTLLGWSRILGTREISLLWAEPIGAIGSFERVCELFDLEYDKETRQIDVTSHPDLIVSEEEVLKFLEAAIPGYAAKVKQGS